MIRIPSIQAGHIRALAFMPRHGKRGFICVATCHESEELLLETLQASGKNFRFVRQPANTTVRYHLGRERGEPYGYPHDHAYVPPAQRKPDNRDAFVPATE